MNKKEITLQEFEMKVFRNEMKNKKPIQVKITLDNFFNIKKIKKKDVMIN